MIVQVDNLVIKITFKTEYHCPLVFWGGKGGIENMEIALFSLNFTPFMESKVEQRCGFHSLNHSLKIE